MELRTLCFPEDSNWCLNEPIPFERLEYLNNCYFEVEFFYKLFLFIFYLYFFYYFSMVGWLFGQSKIFKRDKLCNFFFLIYI